MCARSASTVRPVACRRGTSARPRTISGANLSSSFASHPGCRTAASMSDREVVVHEIVRELGDGCGGDDAALVDDSEFARHAARERQLLLHEQHREFRLAIQALDEIADLRDDVRLDALAGLIEYQ